jgi:hypothetical protein
VETVLLVERSIYQETHLDERRKAFRFLIAVLAIADGRRRERFCFSDCSHWWHRLSVARQPSTAL